MDAYRMRIGTDTSFDLLKEIVMSFTGFGSHCPKCANEITTDRIVDGHAICACGWVDNSAYVKAEGQRQKNLCKLFAVAALVMVLGYGYALSWGPYAGTIPFIKVATLTGMASPETYNQLIEACTVMNKWSCAEQAHLDLFHKTRDPEALARLAKLQTLLKNLPAASDTYAAYFKAGGKNPDVPFFYAEVLEQTGHADQAMPYYQMSVEQNPTKLNANATSAIVHIMMKAQQFEQARGVIDTFRASAENAKGYLNTEEDEITKILGPEKIKRIATAGSVGKTRISF
jgi:tetratricopeptide (TPR) repeat protein